MPGKRNNEIKVRIDDKLLNALALLAHKDERALAEYVHNVLWHHVYGHVCSVCDSEEECEQKRRG